MILLAFLIGAAFGALTHRSIIDGLMLAQRDTHKKEMGELADELKRARIQVANLIGKE